MTSLQFLGYTLMVMGTWRLFGAMNIYVKMINVGRWTHQHPPTRDAHWLTKGMKPLISPPQPWRLKSRLGKRSPPPWTRYIRASGNPRRRVLFAEPWRLKSRLGKRSPPSWTRWYIRASGNPRRRVLFAELRFQPPSEKVLSGNQGFYWTRNDIRSENHRERSDKYLYRKLLKFIFFGTFFHEPGL